MYVPIVLSVPSPAALMASVMRYTTAQTPTVDYAQASAAPPPPPVDIFAGVPEIVEDRRLDANGGTVVRRYERGRLLGKVSFNHVVAHVIYLSLSLAQCGVCLILKYITNCHGRYSTLPLPCPFPPLSLSFRVDLHVVLNSFIVIKIVYLQEKLLTKKLYIKQERNQR